MDDSFRRTLSESGFSLDPESRIKLLLDMLRAFALSTLQEMDRTGVRVIVVTWNSCPEHMQDLRDLLPEALLASNRLLERGVAEVLAEALEAISNGESYELTGRITTSLTAVERDVLRYVARGWETRDIAAHLCVAEQTVKNRLGNVYDKLGFHSHARAVVYYWDSWQPPKRK